MTTFDSTKTELSRLLDEIVAPSGVDPHRQISVDQMIGAPKQRSEHARS